MRKVLSNIYIGCYTRNYFFDKIGSKRVWFSGIKFADYDLKVEEIENVLPRNVNIK
jgi:hypothetical protein